MSGAAMPVAGPHEGRAEAERAGELPLGGQRDAQRERRDTASFGMWIFIASEAMFFGGLFFAYLYGRSRFPAGFGAASRATDVVLGTANTALLLTSSFVVALAVAAGTHGRRRLVAPSLAAAAALGMAFLAVKFVEYRKDWAAGFFPGANFHLGGGGAGVAPPGAELFAMLYFTTTGVHALHLTIGIAWLGLLAFGARHASEDAIDPPRLDVAGLYWHFVDVVWIFLYPLLYLVSRAP